MAFPLALTISLFTLLTTVSVAYYLLKLPAAMPCSMAEMLAFLTRAKEILRGVLEVLTIAKKVLEEVKERPLSLAPVGAMDTGGWAFLAPVGTGY
ncbi:hypothetical protein DTO012A9_10132 [Penicillium roqueforti]|nr:hypothetical protein DTO012A9_10132 [Penicillium roqueforti]